MTDAEVTALGRRAVACKAWRWMPGMLHAGGIGERVLAVCDRYLTVAWPHVDTIATSTLDGAFPDLRDPATVGCLLALVREAWHEPRFCVGFRPRGRADPTPDLWYVEADCGGSVIPATLLFHRTEAEALIAALEAAP